MIGQFGRIREHAHLLCTSHVHASVEGLTVRHWLLPVVAGRRPRRLLLLHLVVATRLSTCSTALQGCHTVLLHSPLLQLQAAMLLQRGLLTQPSAAWVGQFTLWHADVRAVLDQFCIELLIHRLSVSGRDLRCDGPLQFGNDSGVNAIRVPSLIVLFLLNAVEQARRIVRDHLI